MFSPILIENGQLSTIHFVACVPLHYTVWKFQDFSTLRFYVKSNLVVLEVRKSAIIAISKPLNLEFSKFQFHEIAKISLSQNSEPLKRKNGTFSTS